MSKFGKEDGGDNQKKERTETKLPKKVVKSFGEKLDAADRLFRLPWFSFLNTKLNNSNVEKYLELHQALQDARHKLNGRSYGSDYGSNAFYVMMKNYMNSKPSSATTRRVADLMSFMYPGMESLVRDMILSARTMNEPHTSDVEELARIHINSWRNSERGKKEWNSNLHPNIPHYFVGRTAQNMGTLVDLINENEDKRDEIATMYNNYTSEPPEINQVNDKFLNFMYQLEDQQRQGILQPYQIRGTVIPQTWGPAQYYEYARKEFDKNIKNVFEHYEEHLKFGNHNVNWNDIKERGTTTPSALIRGNMNDAIYKTLKGESENFLSDINKAIYNTALNVKRMEEGSDDLPQRALYNIEARKMKGPSIDDEIQAVNAESKLNEIRQRFNTNMTAPDYLLDFGDEDYIDTGRLLKYLSHKNIDEIKGDSKQMIENYLYNGKDPDKIYDKIQNNVDWSTMQEIMSAYNSPDGVGSIPIKYYPMLYSHSQKFNDSKFQKIKAELVPHIEEQIQQNLDNVSNFLKDKTTTITHLSYINSLLGKVKNQNILPIVEALSEFESNEEKEAKDIVAMLEGKDNLSDQEKEDLANAIDDLRKMKETRKGLKALINSYNEDGSVRQKMMEEGSELLQNYQKSLDLLRETVVNHNEQNYVDWSSFRNYFMNELAKQKTIEDAERVHNEGRLFLRFLKLAGADTQGEEDMLSNILQLKRNTEMIEPDDAFVRDHIKNIVEEINELYGVNLNTQANLESLSDQINNLNKVTQEDISRHLQAALPAALEKQFHNLYTKYDDFRSEQYRKENELLDKYGASKEEFAQLKRHVSAEKEETVNRINDLLKELNENKTLSEEDRNLISNQVDQLQLAIQSITDEKKANEAIGEMIGKKLKKQEDDTAATWNKMAENHQAVIRNLNQLEQNIKHRSTNDMSAVAEAIQRNAVAMEQLYQENFGVGREVRGWLEANDEKVSKEIADYHNVLRDDINSANQYFRNYIDEAIARGRDDEHKRRLNEILERYDNRFEQYDHSLNEFKNLVGDVLTENTKLGAENIKRQKRLEESQRELNANYKDLSNVTVSTYEDTMQRLAENETFTKNTLNELKGDLREIYKEARGLGEPVSKEQRQNIRLENAFKDEDKVRQALLSNVIKLSEDEDIKQKYFREKISQPKLKAALGLLPTDPDLTLDQVEKYLPAGFFADVQSNIQDKTIAPIKIKTTHYEAANATSDAISEGLKKQLLRWYYYYKDPKQRTAKKNEYPREFLLDLAMLNTNGSPQDIEKRYKQYLKNPFGRI